MKILSVLTALLLVTGTHDAQWGQTGHRVTGAIAADYLNPGTRQEIDRVLGNESLAMASTWMDAIRSDSRYDHTRDWHWVTIPGGMTYEETEKNPNGDIIRALETMIAELKAGNLDEGQEREKLRMIIHLIGDIHQPLHVGTGEDRGGNQARVQWMWESSNLHRVWDSDMIDQTQLSYTELARSINFPTEEQIEEWQRSDVRDWAYESMDLRPQVYDLPDDGNIGYEYQYKYFDIVERRLLQAGVRLAGVLNEIYDNDGGS